MDGYCMQACVQYGTVLGLTTLLELDDTEEADGTAEDATLREVM